MTDALRDTSHDATSSAANRRRSCGSGVAVVALLMSLATISLAAPLPGTVLEGRAQVVDGDTIEIAGQRIRLEGIDAPEQAQTCTTANAAPWACGKAATRALFELVGQETVACESVGNDKYGRILGLCFLDGEDINRYMVEAGYAWAFVKFSSKYVNEESAARTAKIGIWQGPARPAWEYRSQGWEVAESTAPKGCAIKGNISAHGQIYHLPWSPWYGKVTIDETKGERWFCSEDEAQVAGWRAAAN
jgi:endonuclease YncB( thermonuclease family)